MNLLSSLSYYPLEIIIVDNCSHESVDKIVNVDHRAKLIRNSVNLGATGRNRGMTAATGKIIVTLDDDVFGLTDLKLYKLCELMKDEDIAAINFKVKDDGGRRIINWCHPYKQEFYSEKEFETNEISEGAVAFRANALKQVGVYPEYFFISHEGADLALRLINTGWKVVYTPEITVIHTHDNDARQDWRRYYYDTRNELWLALRNLPLWLGIKRLSIAWIALMIYSIRDGYFIYWIKAIRDSIFGASRALKDRRPLTIQAQERIKTIEMNKPSFLYMAKKRLFGNEIRI